MNVSTLTTEMGLSSSSQLTLALSEDCFPRGFATKILSAFLVFKLHDQPNNNILFKVKDQDSEPCKTTGKTVYSYSLLLSQVH
jgi:hypothetical protein